MQISLLTLSLQLVLLVLALMVTTMLLSRTSTLLRAMLLSLRVQLSRMSLQICTLRYLLLPRHLLTSLLSSTLITLHSLHTSTIQLTRFSQVMLSSGVLLSSLNTTRIVSTSTPMLRCSTLTMIFGTTTSLRALPSTSARRIAMLMRTTLSIAQSYQVSLCI